MDLCYDYLSSNTARWLRNHMESPSSQSSAFMVSHSAYLGDTLVVPKPSLIGRPWCLNPSIGLSEFRANLPFSQVWDYDLIEPLVWLSGYSKIAMILGWLKTQHDQHWLADKVESPAVSPPLRRQLDVASNLVTTVGTYVVICWLDSEEYNIIRIIQHYTYNNIITPIYVTYTHLIVCISAVPALFDLEGPCLTGQHWGATPPPGRKMDWRTRNIINKMRCNEDIVGYNRGYNGIYKMIRTLK